MFLSDPSRTIHLLTKRLTAAGNGNPKRSVEELAASVLGCRPLEIYFREMSTKQAVVLEALTERAAQGEPVQYLIGHVDFRGMRIACDSRALIPRPETEVLVETALSSLAACHGPLAIADVGTGTGCIGLALLSELPEAEVTAVDVSAAALSLAQENADRLGLSRRFHCLQNNLLTGFADNSLDGVVSNPPYIASAVCKTIDSSVRGHEPAPALDGGADGLDLIRPLTEQAARVLKPGAGLFLEIGFDQGAAVARILEQAGFQRIACDRDCAGHDRIISGFTPGKKY
jgi:release factor glutamine methyltransferase